MAAQNPKTNSSNANLLEELEALSHSLYQTHTSTTRRAASLVLPRTSVPSVASLTNDDFDPAENEKTPASDTRPRFRRLSLSPWRSRPKNEDENGEGRGRTEVPLSTRKEMRPLDEKMDTAGRKGLWNWKPIRALSHIGRRKLSCLFSVEVVGIQGLPATMNGLRLSVCVKKKETKEGAVQTMPSKVSQGEADFEETLFVRCHVYCSPGNGKQLKLEPRPFQIYPFAVDAKELDFGRSVVDLSLLIQESMDKNWEGSRIRQWDMVFNLLGKAKGAQLVLKFGFQILEQDGGLDIYNRPQGSKSGASSSLARKQSKSSFSILSPKITRRPEPWSPSRHQAGVTADFRGMDELNLDEPAPPPVQKSGEPESRIDDVELPEFEIVDKGVEIVETSEEKQVKEEERIESTPGEAVKEVMHDPIHLTRLTELDSIAQQIKDLESMMGEERVFKVDAETESQRLDAEEETVTREFLRMLESEGQEYKFNPGPKILQRQKDGEDDTGNFEIDLFLPDLAKGLGCVVQTRHGGYLASMNPLNTAVKRKDTPKLAMQLSRPVVLPSLKSLSGVELFRMLAATGVEELSNEVLSLMPMDDLTGKTAEQIAFEGIASVIIHDRNKKGTSSSAARTIATVKMMATAMSTGRKERISTGIWNVNENHLAADEILASTLQQIEAMAIEALKIQADMAEEKAPYDISPDNKKDQNRPLASATALEDRLKNGGPAVSDGEPPHTARSITLSTVVQLRDPLRQYEVVGGPMVALIQATISADVKPGTYDENKGFKVASLHVGGIKLSSEGSRNVWDTGKQRLTAMQWLVAYGLGKSGKKEKTVTLKGQNLLWSISSRVIGNMWLRPTRNPDVRFSK